MAKNRWRKKNSQQIREMLAGEHESQTKLQVGYKESTSNPWDGYKKGDKWVDDDGNKWEITLQGAIIKHGKLDEERRLAKLYINCPKEKCTKNQWNEHHVDKRTKKIHGMCMDCLIEQDTKKMIDGTWDEYTEVTRKQNQLAELREMEEEVSRIKSVFETGNHEYVNKEGDIEKWAHGITPEIVEEKFQEFKKTYMSDRNISDEEYEEFKQATNKIRKLEQSDGKIGIEDK